MFIDSMSNRRSAVFLKPDVCVWESKIKLLIKKKITENLNKNTCDFFSASNLPSDITHTKHHVLN